MNNYEELKCIGNGSFGQVYLVKSKSDGQKYALKTIRMVDIKEKDRKNIENEVSLKHIEVSLVKKNYGLSWSN